MHKRRFLDTAPLILICVLLLVVYLNWKLSPTHTENSFVSYLLEQKTDFLIAIATILVQYFITISVFKSIESELSGKWDIILSPSNWKGSIDKQEVAAIVGKGVLLISKATKTKDSYTGILQVSYTKILPDGHRVELHRGAYEIYLDRSGNKVTGWSLATVEDRSFDPTAADSDFPSQNKCLYTLQYNAARQTLTGTAKMRHSETISEFEAHKLA